MLDYIFYICILCIYIAIYQHNGDVSPEKKSGIRDLHFIVVYAGSYNSQFTGTSNKLIHSFSRTMSMKTNTPRCCLILGY